VRAGPGEAIEKLRPDDEKLALAWAAPVWPAEAPRWPQPEEATRKTNGSVETSFIFAFPVLLLPFYFFG
jgi:hypothetical protein